MPFTFAKGHLSLAGCFHSFRYDFVFCQEPSSCRLTVHMDPENLENRFGGDDDAAELTVSSSELPCLSRIFCRTICFMLGSCLRYSSRSRSFCDNPLALNFAEEEELCSFFSFLIGVAGAMAFDVSNKCKLWRVNFFLFVRQKYEHFLCHMIEFWIQSTI